MRTANSMNLLSQCTAKHPNPQAVTKLESRKRKFQMLYGHAPHTATRSGALWGGHKNRSTVNQSVIDAALLSTAPVAGWDVWRARLDAHSVQRILLLCVAAQIQKNEVKGVAVAHAFIWTDLKGPAVKIKRNISPPATVISVARIHPSAHIQGLSLMRLNQTLNPFIKGMAIHDQRTRMLSALPPPPCFTEARKHRSAKPYWPARRMA